jgi:hypothetical protein
MIISKEAIRQPLIHWTIEGLCAILFRRHVQQGPGFDGKIEFRAGRNSIIISEHVFVQGVRYQTQDIYEFKKVTKEMFAKENDSKEIEGMIRRRESRLKFSFLIKVDEFIGMTTPTNRKDQFNSTLPIFLRMVDRMEATLGSPHFKESKSTPI